MSWSGLIFEKHFSVEWFFHENFLDEIFLESHMNNENSFVIHIILVVRTAIFDNYVVNSDIVVNEFKLY